MNPESHPNDPPEDDLRLPPEILRALAKSQAKPILVPPEIDAAILRAAKAHLSPARPRNLHRFLWPLAVAACLMLVFALRRPDSSGNPKPPMVGQEEDAAAIILREVSALFPNQVRSIVKDESGLQMTLAEEPNVQASQALVLKVCQPRGCQEIITFSGQNIKVAGHLVTVRTENNGRVILDGEKFLWSSDINETSVPDVHIESRRL
jgi:hypothetical protein